MLTETNKLSWEDFDKLSRKIYREIIESKVPIDSIIGIARGGLSLSGFLAYQLSIKKLYIINTQLYSDKKLISPKILYYPKEIKLNHVLVVDDILDTGSTYYLLKDLLAQIAEKSYWAVLIDKGKSNINVDFTGHKLNRDIWVEFPWN
ncbi:MAG: phosphoribosyltransferase family protein [Candidatus Margulisbacteria bacterium]|nr:phosphoribosyltransferase family protein [Candidatus Margulisiibacteriota bacterium]